MRSQASHKRRLARIEAFWRQLTDGLTLHDLWSQFRRQTVLSYRPYSADLERRDEQSPRRRHGFVRSMLRAIRGPRRSSTRWLRGRPTPAKRRVLTMSSV